MYKLRYYQKNAVEYSIEWIKKNLEPAVIEIPTGGGKTICIAKLAEWYLNKTNKRVLCIAPKSELVTQGVSKLKSIGIKVSIYSASAGQKCLRHRVIFGTPMSIKNSIKSFPKDIGLVIIDEGEGITKTIYSILGELKDLAKSLRIIGLTASPYRTGTGYVYCLSNNGEIVNDSENAFYKKLIYKVNANELMEKGYLTQPVIGDIYDHYDTSKLTLNNMGKFDSKSIDKAFVGQGRLTAQIIADIVERSQSRKGVLIFCATIQHAYEALESLPKDKSSIITGKTKNRQSILKDFEQNKIKYLVNVDVLTVGIDYPHIDVIALLRRTESARLFVQICGRGTRLLNGKDNFLILDYAENIDRHCPDGDIFDPELTVNKPNTGGSLEIICPDCKGVNHVAPINDIDKLLYNEYGNLIDLNGNEILEDDQPVPVHHGRRCANFVEYKKEFKQCNHRWNSKECPECGQHNDIAARYCAKCKAEIIDPNEKLQLDFKRLKKNPRALQTDLVREVEAKLSISKKGNEMLLINWTTPYRHFKTYHTPLYKSKWKKLFSDLSIKQVIDDINKQEIKTVTYQKQPSDFFEIFAFNQPEDTI